MIAEAADHYRESASLVSLAPADLMADWPARARVVSQCTGPVGTCQGRPVYPVCTGRQTVSDRTAFWWSVNRTQACSRRWPVSRATTNNGAHCLCVVAAMMTTSCSGTAAAAADHVTPWKQRPSLSRLAQSGRTRSRVSTPVQLPSCHGWILFWRQLYSKLH